MLHTNTNFRECLCVPVFVSQLDVAITAVCDWMSLWGRAAACFDVLIIYLSIYLSSMSEYYSYFNLYMHVNMSTPVLQSQLALIFAFGSC